MRGKAKIVALALAAGVVYFVCNLDSPYDPLDPSTHTHYSTFREMAVASLVTLASVPVLICTLFLFVLVIRMCKGRWDVHKWFPEFWRNFWRSFKD